MKRKGAAHRLTLRYLSTNLGIVVGLVLIWRGIWYLLDTFDYLFLNNNHFISGVIGIIVGVLILYLPDKNLDELKKL